MDLGQVTIAVVSLDVLEACAQVGLPDPIDASLVKTVDIKHVAKQSPQS